MNKKNKRITLLLEVSNSLNHPISGVSNKHDLCTYKKPDVLFMMNKITEMLALDGVFTAS